MSFRSLTFFIFLFSISGLAQDITISGTVADTNNEPIAYANVVLLNTEDSSFVSGSTTNDNGVFEILTTGDKNGIIKISFLGFEEVLIPLDKREKYNLGVIILKEKTESLEGVTVIAKRPTVNRMVDRLVFNVENSTLSDSNVLDVLKHTPGVLVHDGNITIKNSTPTVYINDRKVHLSINEVQQLLEGTSATNVKSVEVITNPPAKYEAEGGAVLNIVTSKNIIAGYNGSVFGNYKQGSEYPKYSFGTSHFFKAKKLNTYLNYNISPRKDYRHNDELVNFIQDNNIISTWETDFKRSRENANQNINANIDYEIDENNHIGFSSSILLAPRDNTKTQVNSETNVFGANKILDSIFETENKLRDEKFNFAFTLDYTHKFKNEGEKISISTHHTNYDFSSFQNVDTDYLFPDESLIRNNSFQTFSSQIIKLYTGQLDYELPIDDSSVFEAGGKVSNINSESIFRNDERIKDLENSDTFFYDETNYAAYSSFSKDWNKWSLKTGLRFEFTNIKGNSLSTNQIENNNYVKFFPSFYVLNKLNENNDLYFSYNKRIHRPRYSDLNPFKYFLSDNVYEIGDPNLKPQIDDVITLGYTLNNIYTFEIYYSRGNNYLLESIFQNNEDNLIVNIDTNIDSNTSYGLDFTTYTEILPNWNLYVLSSFFYYENDFHALESNNSLFTLSRYSIYSQIINYFSFLKDKSLTADVSYLYISPIVEGSRTINTRQGLDINFRKTFYNKRISINFGISDLFNSQNFTQRSKYLNQDLYLKSRLENRLITFGFNYKFGNYKLAKNNKAIELKERERLD